VFELLWLLLSAVLTSLRPRQDLVLESLLLRHQLAALIYPTRTRPRPRLRLWDKLCGSATSSPLLFSPIVAAGRPTAAA
jgi:hypothetical protein